MMNTLLDIHMINNKGFIWNANDWYDLRSKHRLLGSLIGTLPSATRQEDQNGLPCLLLPEEIRFLVENNIGRTVEYSAFTSLQNKHCLHKKDDSISKLMVNSILPDENTNSKEVNISKPFNTSSYTLIHLDGVFSDMNEVPLAKFMIDLERIRYKVFKDLWSKGFYLTCGMKFGGDFLVYEGDPLAYHAKYIVSCRDLDKEIMVSRSRVSAITKKKMVLAKDDGDSVKYLIYHLNDSTKTIYKQPIHFLL